jgi:ATP-dependent Lon protease
MSDTNTVITTFENLPMLALRGLSVFPNMLLNFDVERAMSVAALNVASEGERRIFLLAQKDISKESPTEADLYKVGTICYVKQLLRIPGGGIKVLVEGQCRAALKKILSDRKYFFAEVEPIAEEIPEKMTPRVEALIRKCVGLFDSYSSLTGNVTKEAVIAIYSSSEPGYIADYIAQNMYMKPEKKQLILETVSPVKRLELVADMLLREIEVIEIEHQIDERLRGRLERQQRDHVLREQLRVIQSELGESQESATETDDYRSKILALRLDEEIEKKLLREVERLEKQQFGSSESAVIRNYLDICIELPWKTESKERLDIRTARKILDSL